MAEINSSDSVAITVSSVSIAVLTFSKKEKEK
jgi:hypothetical protein